MLTDTQKKTRVAYVGASEVAAIWPLIFGGDRIDPYRDAVDVFKSKKGLIPDKPVSNQMMEGTLLEDGYRQVAECYLEMPLEADAEFIHPTCPLIAHTDGVNREKKVIVEIKRVSDPRMLAEYGRANTDQVPRCLMLQMQAQMCAAGPDYKLAYAVADRISSTRGGIGVYKVRRDEQIVRGIEYAVSRFWGEYVTKNIQPPSFKEINEYEHASN